MCWGLETCEIAFNKERFNEFGYVTTFLETDVATLYNPNQECCRRETMAGGRGCCTRTSLSQNFKTYLNTPQKVFWTQVGQLRVKAASYKIK